MTCDGRLCFGFKCHGRLESVAVTVSKVELESDGSGFNWLDVCDVQLCRHLSHFPEGLGGANSRGEAKIKCHLRGEFRQMALVG